VFTFSSVFVSSEFPTDAVSDIEPELRSGTEAEHELRSENPEV
jgi:hypothetical protein